MEFFTICSNQSNNVFEKKKIQNKFVISNLLSKNKKQNCKYWTTYQISNTRQSLGDIILILPGQKWDANSPEQITDNLWENCEL